MRSTASKKYRRKWDFRRPCLAAAGAGIGTPSTNLLERDLPWFPAFHSSSSRWKAKSSSPLKDTHPDYIQFRGLGKFIKVDRLQKNDFIDWCWNLLPTMLLVLRWWCWFLACAHAFHLDLHWVHAGGVGQRLARVSHVTCHNYTTKHVARPRVLKITSRNRAGCDIDSISSHKF